MRYAFNRRNDTYIHKPTTVCLWWLRPLRHNYNGNTHIYSGTTANHCNDQLVIVLVVYSNEQYYDRSPTIVGTLAKLNIITHKGDSPL